MYCTLERRDRPGIYGLALAKKVRKLLALCLSLGGGSAGTFQVRSNPIAEAVLFIQELQRNGIIAGLICDLDRDLRALRYRTGERNVQSRSHYRVLLVKDKLDGVSSVQ